MEPLLEYLVKRMGPVLPGPRPRPGQVESWRGRMPELVLTWWEEVGFAGFARGLIWLTDPDEWADLARDTLRVSRPLRSDLEPVIASGTHVPWLRTAFGEMYCWSPVHGAALCIDPIHRQVSGTDYADDLTDGLPNIGLETVVLSNESRFDTFDEDGARLFDRVHRALGPVGPDTAYGLTPAAALGGPVRVENFSIEPARGHLTMLADI